MAQIQHLWLPHTTTHHPRDPTKPTEIEVVDEVETRNQESASASASDSAGGGGVNGVGEDSLRNDVYTAAAYEDLEKLYRGRRGRSIGGVGGHGWSPLRKKEIGKRGSGRTEKVWIVEKRRRKRIGRK
ncbi:protein S-acyltransferase 24 [Fagus crenata]